MTKEQTIKLMEYFQAAYRGFYDGKNTTDVLKVWFDAFKDEEPAVINAAAKNYVKFNEFPPTIAGMNKQIKLIKEQETDTDTWGKLLKAIRNGTYGYKEEFEKLPPECQSFLGGASALKDLAQTDTGTINTIVKGQFLKRVESIKEHQEVQRGLPMEVRQAIEASKVKMIGEEQWD